MAIIGVKNFQAGAILTAADLNTYNRGVFVFASSAARTSAFSSAGITLTEGWMSYLTDTNSTEYYDGSAWQPVSAPLVYNGAVASGSAIAITGSGTYLLTGTTAVNTITGTTVAGTVVTLVASGQAARVCVVINNAATANAITLKNSQAVGLYSSDSITLVYNGTYWQEIARALKPVIDYSTVTSGTVNVTGTTAGTATTVFTGNAVTYDGASAYRFEFWTPVAAIGTASNIKFGFWEDGTQNGMSAQTNSAASPLLLVQIRTPTNASHTQTVRGFVNAGTATVDSGTGTTTATSPMYLRITREV